MSNGAESTKEHRADSDQPVLGGGSFLDYCVRQGWMLKEREGRSVRDFATPAGVVALRDFGIEIRVPAKPAGSKPSGQRTQASRSE
jgi:hypothetical protein